MAVQRNTAGEGADFQESQLSIFDAYSDGLQEESLPSIYHSAEVTEREAPEQQSRVDAATSTEERLKEFLDPGIRSKHRLERDFEKLFNTLTYSRNRGQVFHDFAEIAAVWMGTALYDHAALFGVKMFDQDKLYESLVSLGDAVKKRYKDVIIKKF